ncbi:hypothetical protein [Natronorubrum sp. DTA7]|uniref:hypothetical protein n=1 Tax=Natronorubrum sp. DTA7 TaxID=3447016 RepID=UPI003F86BED4
MTETVSAKIPDELKRDIDGADINVSEVIRDALENEVKECRREQLRNDAASLRKEVGDGVETDEIVSAIRETREER